jgi:hypothetical protein
MFGVDHRGPSPDGRRAENRDVGGRAASG